MSLVDLLGSALMLAGALFCLLAGVGVWRLPDVYCRLSAMSKASPFGITLLLAGGALLDGSATFAVQAALIAIFLTLTAPIAGHALGRAAHAAGARPSETSVRDDLPADVSAERDDE